MCVREGLYACVSIHPYLSLLLLLASSVEVVPIFIVFLLSLQGIRYQAPPPFPVSFKFIYGRLQYFFPSLP